ncbi:Uncharacterised protein [Candidatus Burarchaeum australiense]|nr:Uncharacterised protein [Candidatus Burarchaeum australiense]
MILQPPIGAYIGRNTKEQFGREKILSYGKHPFNDAIIDACRLEEFRGSPGPKNMLDLKCGPGKLSLEIIFPYYEELRRQNPGEYPPVEMYFNDAREGPLRVLEENGHAGHIICCAVEDLPLQEPFRKYDGIIERYGLKESAGQEIIEREMTAVSYVLKDTGIFVLGEMTAYSDATRESAEYVHGTKHGLAGRDLETEGMPTILKPDQWKKSLVRAGFTDITEHGRFTSNVETRQWEGQYGKEKQKEKEAMTAIMNRTILMEAEKNPAFKEEFNVRSEMVDGIQIVRLDFPISVISARIW